MSNEKPKVGLLLLSAEWFAKIGANQGSFRELPNQLRADAAAIEQALSLELTVVNPGILATRPQVTEAAKRFELEGVDLVIACQITWGEDRLIIEVVQQLPLMPFLVWCYSPLRRLPNFMTMTDLFRTSGPVGTLQASAPLKRLGKKFGVVFGSHQNPDVIRRIISFAKAARVARELRHATIGVLPYRCDQMTGTYIDEFRLKKEIGPELKYISSFDYRTVCEEIPIDQVTALVQELRTSYSIAPSVTDKGLEQGARVSLGLARLVEKYQLEAIAIEDVGEELHRVVGLRPCLSIPALFDRAVVSMEAEVGGAVALLILRQLTGKSPMYTEAFTYDEEANCLLLGHAGIHDVRLAQSAAEVLIEPDGEFAELEPDSVWMSFRAKSGHVTLLSVFCDTERFKLVITSGEALSSGPRLLGSPHAYVKLAMPLADFFDKTIKTGMTQHWALVHDVVVDELVTLADILGLEKVII